MTTPNKSEFLLYYSLDDGIWIAHELHMDQLGTGDTPEEALRDGYKGIKLLRKEAAKDPTLRLMCEAPDDVKARVTTAMRWSDLVVSAICGPNVVAYQAC